MRNLDEKLLEICFAFSQKNKDFFGGTKKIKMEKRNRKFLEILTYADPLAASPLMGRAAHISSWAAFLSVGAN